MIKVEKMSNKCPTSSFNPLHHIINRETGLGAVNFRQKLFRDRLSVAKNLFKKDLQHHFGCVNAIEFSKDGNLLISGKIKIIIILIYIGVYACKKTFKRFIATVFEKKSLFMNV